MSKRSRSGGERRWLMIDAGMNDLIRPALYAARHRIEPIDSAAARERGARVARGRPGVRELG
jgi:diaminopimelate decarboxylase